MPVFRFALSLKFFNYYALTLYILYILSDPSLTSSLAGHCVGTLPIESHILKDFTLATSLLFV